MTRSGLRFVVPCEIGANSYSCHPAGGNGVYCRGRPRAAVGQSDVYRFTQSKPFPGGASWGFRERVKPYPTGVAV